jgi:hypothetical protein
MGVAPGSPSESEPEFGEEHNHPVGDQRENQQEEDLERSNAGFPAKNFALQSFPGRPMQLLAALAAFGFGPQARVSTAMAPDIHPRTALGAVIAFAGVRMAALGAF